MSAKKKRLCVICSARVRNINPKTVTCSPFCTEQKNSGKSRDELVREDSIIAEGGR